MNDLLRRCERLTPQPALRVIPTTPYCTLDHITSSVAFGVCYIHTTLHLRLVHSLPERFDALFLHHHAFSQFRPLPFLH